MDAQTVLRKLQLFIEREAEGSSPLYAELAARVSKSPELVQLVSHGPENQPTPHLFFATVQYLLRKKGEAITARTSSDKAFALLNKIAQDQRDEVTHLLSNRIVQTNEVRRSTYLYLAWVRICQDFPGRDFALVEIGASAGFNLLFDKYEYQLDDSAPFGDLDAEVSIKSKLTGGGQPKTDRPDNSIVSRLGLDLNPLDVNSSDDVEWLRALIWPEHEERFRLLEEAIAVRRGSDIEMIKGDGIALLPSVFASIPTKTIPFVFHTHVGNQLSMSSREALLHEIDEQGTQRDIVHLHNTLEPHLHATSYQGRIRQDLKISSANGHASSIEWFDQVIKV